MSLFVIEPRAHSAARRDQQVVSPELVLVDPGLAEQARAWLPPPDDTFARIAELARVRALVEARAHRPQPPSASRAPAPALASVSVAPAGRRASSRARSALLAGGVAAVLAISLLVGVRVDVGGQPAGADSTIGQSAPKTPTPPHRTAATKAPRPAPRPRTKAPARRRTAVAAPTRHRFAWAPTKGASGYDVEFFVAGRRVYVGHSTGPTIEVPARWQYEGAQHSFRAGEYGWYVWPEIGGKRSSQASVQTTISIARG